MEMDRRRLRPMGIGDILDEAFHLFRSNFALLAGVCAVIYVPFYVLVAIIGASVGGSIGPTIVQMAAVVRAIFFDFLITGALTYAVSQAYLGHITSVSDSYRFIGRRFWRAIKTQLLASITVMLPFMVIAFLAAILFPLIARSGSGSASIVATIILIPLIAIAIFFTIRMAVRFIVVLPVFIVEGIGGSAALKRSYGLVAGFGLKAFVISVIAQLIISILQSIVVMPVRFISTGPIGIAIGAVLDGVTSSVLVPIIAIVYILIYYDLRIRKEGFDLEILAQELEQRKQAAEPTKV